jgi:superfamily II DNA or RNA helicase
MPPPQFPVATPTFEELERVIAALPEDANKERGTRFEELVQRFLERDPAIRSGYGIAKVWLWADWPDRVRYFPQEPEGVGVDHVIESTDGNLIAVQAKFVSDPTNATRLSDLTSFIGRVALPGSPFSGGLLVSNAFSLSRKVEREFSAAHDPATGRGIGVALRDVLVASEIDWSPAAPAAPRPPYTRRPGDQVAAVADVVKTLQEHDRTKLIAACGTGKTLMTYWAARDLAAERILVLLPSLALVRQFRTEWAEAANREGWNPTVYAVCSEKDRGGADVALLRADELGVRMVATPDTDPAVIATWLRRPGPSIVFSTYQSSPRIAEAMGDASIPAFDLIVADEAHNIVTAESTSAFRTVIDGDRLRARRRLFATATEKLFSDRVKSKAADEGIDVISMDDEAQFGPMAHQISFAQAIDLQLITDYQIVIAEIAEEDSELAARRMIAERRFVDAPGVETTDAATLAAGLALARAAKELGFSRMISFHTRAKRGSGGSRTAGAEAFAELMTDLEPSWRVAFVSGEQPTASRAEIVRSTLAVTPGERGLVTNARCLGEGVDLPDLEAVAFVDPRNSIIDIVQSASRALRLPKTITKETGYIVIPVVVPKGVDMEAAMEGKAYAQVYQVVRAMRGHDERLAEEIDALRVGKGTRSVASRPLSDLIVRTGDLGSRTIDLAAWRKRIVISVVERTYDSWATHLAALEAFRTEHGHLRVPAKYIDPSGVKLGSWVANRRTDYTVGRLTAERIAALEALGMVWDPLTDDFARGLAALERFRAAHGHLRVSQNYVDPSGVTLGSWVSHRRKEYTAERLAPERIAALEVLGMIWDPLTDGFARGLAALERFRAAHGHLRVPDKYIDSNGVRLGIWVRNRRTDYAAGRIATERVASLESIGMVWDELDALFADGLSHYARFVQREGHGRVVAVHMESGYPLGQWLAGKRTERDRGKRSLTPERIADLDALGMVWDPFADDFARGLAALESFRAEHGHLRVPNNYVDPSGVRLGSWVANRRADYTVGRLAPERIATLDSLGMVWDSFADDFTRGIAALERFRAEHGHLRVPRNYVDPSGVTLGSWVGHRRKEYAAGRLAPERIATLDSLGMVWDSFADDFTRGIAALERFRAEHGHLRVPRNYVDPSGLTLGIWVSNRRTDYTVGRLAPERIATLDSLGMVWDPLADDFARGLAALESFRAAHGHLRVSKRYIDPSGFKIGSWVADRRKDYVVGRLAPERIATLDSLGMVWDPFADDFARGLAALESFRAEHGHLRVAAKYIDSNGFRLGSWVANRRTDYTVGSLTAERIAALEALGMVWSARTKKSDS